MIRFGCANCPDKNCLVGLDCSGIASVCEEKISQPDTLRIMKAASYVESAFYMKKTRLEEIIEFSGKMKYQRLGVAFCIGLSEEARAASEAFSRYFEVISVCCKVCGINKENLGLKKVRSEAFEATCNPAGQAEILNRAKTDLNIIIGLCIGHDMIFTKLSEAPVTTFIVKDRVLAHNPAGVVYSNYYKKILNRQE
jgi:uncharacterized metal-binding protein